MKISFLEQAKFELDQAIEYYDFQSAGLGQQFLQEVINALIEFPTFQLSKGMAFTFKKH